MNTEFDPFAEPPRAPVRGRRDRVTGRHAEPPRFSSKATFLSAMIASGVLVGAIWSLYPDGDDKTYSQNTPIVRADSKPMKVIPEDAGGMDIPHRDSTVFSALHPDEDEHPRIENLLADDEDEEPLPRSQLFAGLSTEARESAEQVVSAEKVDIKRPERVIPFDETETVDEIDQSSDVEAGVNAVKDDVQNNVKETVTPVVTAATPLQEKKDSAAPAPSVKPKMSPKVVQAPKAQSQDNLDDVVSHVIGTSTSEAKQTTVSGRYYVQLASVKTRAIAQSEWARYKSKYALGEAHRIQEKDLGEKGVYFRIQSGPYSKEQANAICSDIKKKVPGGCLVTK